MLRKSLATAAGEIFRRVSLIVGPRNKDLSTEDYTIRTSSQLQLHTLHIFCILIASVVSPSTLNVEVKARRHKNSRNSQ